MDKAMKNDLKYIGLLTVLGLVIVLVLSFVLPLRPNPYASDLNKSLEDFAKESCISLCKANKDNLKNIESGPCLSDLFKYDVNDYVCDIVNDPRLEVDNLPENQCKEYLNGSKKKFVEVNTKCEFVRVG